ncbi:MAG: hypothetical protein MJA84_17270 [Firmicutes bacterium]|nr:hypothetical protein [Bacillota bacterium]
MTTATLIRLAGLAAILGGALRIVSAFIPYVPDSAPLEAFYLVIDLALLFGLIGVYARVAGRLGGVGLAGFVVAAGGIAGIVGPDPVAFGIATYQVGVVAISMGLVVLAGQMLRVRAGGRVAPGLWLSAVAVGLLGGAVGWPQAGFVVAGVLFGGGFVAAGWRAWRRAGG